MGLTGFYIIDMAIIRSIYWEQQNLDEFVYKYPVDDITLGSVLTVNDTQEACFFRNGTLYDTFSGGRHVLSTENLPLLNKIVNLPSSGETTFRAEVWFVSKTDRRNLYWGTGGLRVVDPYFEIPLKIYGRGGYGIRINDAVLFLRKFLGTLKQASQDFIEEQFRISVIEAVKVTISMFMKEHHLNINELGAEYINLGRAISKELQTAFDDYGVELLNFNIEEINFDEKDPGYQKVMDSIAEQTRLKRLGLTYMQERQMDVAHAAASNTGSGTFMGIGMGFGVGQALGDMVGGIIQGSNTNQNQTVPPPPSHLAVSYYIAVNGQTTGPYDSNILQQMVVNNQITSETYVYKVGGSAWVKAASDPFFMQLLAASIPPPPPSIT